MSALRISEGANLAIHGMAFIAARAGASCAASEMAVRMGVSRHHLGKVLQRLARRRLVRSKRGPGGGFVLARRAEEISLLEVIEAIDGPFDASACLLDTPACHRGRCAMARFMGGLGERARRFFAETTLAELPRVG